MKRFVHGAILLFAALTADAQTSPALAGLGDVAPGSIMPKMTHRLAWLGGGAPWHGDPITPPLLSALGASWARGTYGYGGTNTDTFAWRCVQSGGSNSWDWTHADAQIRYLRQFPLKVIVQLSQGGDDPPWALTLSTNAYVAAKARFVNQLAARYAGRIWGIEVENEPHPWDGGPAGSWTGYDRHLALLKACQPARQYTKLIGWACQGAWQTDLVYLIRNGLTNLCDSVSWHLYNHGTVPPDVTLCVKPNCVGDADYPGRLDQWMHWLRTQLGDIPIVVDEVGLEPAVPMRMAKVLIMLRAYRADCIQLHSWGYGHGELSAFESDTGRPFPDTVIAAWTAYWLDNNLPTSRKVDANTFIFSFGNRTFAWCLEGTIRACTASGWSSITDIYGNKITPVALTDAVTVFHGTGTLTLTNSSSERVLQMQ